MSASSASTNPGLPEPLICSATSGAGGGRACSATMPMSSGGAQRGGRAGPTGSPASRRRAPAGARAPQGGQVRSSRWYSIVRPAALTSTRRSTRAGNWIASSAPMKPPIELPTTEAAPTRALEQRVDDARVARDGDLLEGIGESPKPGRSIAITRWSATKAGMFSSQFTQLPASPWMKTIVLSPWPRSMTSTPASDVDPPLVRAPVDVEPRRPADRAVWEGVGSGHRRRATDRAAIAAPGTRLRIAIDIDSTLHHYRDLLSAAPRRRFGVDLPYDRQLTWGITGLRAEQLHACVEETHGADVIAEGRPTPTRSRRSTPGPTRATSSTSPPTATRTPTTRRRRGCTRSACATTSCTAPWTRSPAAWRSRSTCSSTTAR